MAPRPFSERNGLAKSDPTLNWPSREGRHTDQSGMNSISSVLAVIVILGLGILGGLVYLGQASAPATQPVEKVLPADQFPR